MATGNAYGPAFAFMAVGGILAYSGFKGRSVTEILAGVTGAPLNPAGGKAQPSRADNTGGRGISGGGSLASVTGGARGIVESAAAIAQQAGGSSVYVVSAFREGSTTSSGNQSDHSGNDETRAARDIAKRGVDAISGPPSPELDRAVVAIGEAFGRNYGNGARKIVDTFTWNGFRIQIIWRTPEYGGHMGHIHVGARKV